MSDNTSDIRLAGHSETTVISHTLSFPAISSDTSALSSTVEASFIFNPSGTMRAGESRGGAEEQRPKGRLYRVRNDGGDARDGGRMEKSNRGFECSPVRALRSYLA